MLLNIIGILCVLMIFVLYYSLIFKKQIDKIDKKLDETALYINKLCSRKIDLIKNGYSFVSEFQNLYNTYAPYHILVSSFSWCDAIKNFKISNIIRIKNGKHPFDVIKAYQNIPMSNSCWINEMIVNKITYMYIEYENDKPFDTNVKCSYAFLRNEHNLPSFVCIMSFTDFVRLSDEDVFKISEAIEKIRY